VSGAWGPGCRGKAPTRGDFLTLGVPGVFLDPWETLLARTLTEARGAAGDAWDRTFAETPVWRFLLGPGALSPAGVVGVMIPSRDRVGRAYPMVVLCGLPMEADAVGVPFDGRRWFEGAETTAAALVAGLSTPEDLPILLASLGRPRVGRGGPAARKLLGSLPDPFSLWWTRGGGAVAPSVLVAPGMPDPAALAALFDGKWKRRGWSDEG